MQAPILDAQGWAGCVMLKEFGRGDFDKGLLKGYRPCRRPQQYGGGGQRSSDACFSISSQMVKSERLDSSYS